MTGRDASFVYKGKVYRFMVEDSPPRLVSYSHRECTTAPIEHLELELAEYDDDRNLVLYRVISGR